MTFLLSFWRRNERLPPSPSTGSLGVCQNTCIVNSRARTLATTLRPCWDHVTPSQARESIRWPLCLSAPPTNKVTCLCLSRAPFSPGGQALHFFLRATPADPHPILLTNYLSLTPRVGRSLNLFVSPLPHLYHAGERKQYLPDRVVRTERVNSHTVLA